jgi:hypothetical protein
VLVEHGGDDVDECLVAGEEAVPAGEQVALEPALALVLGEHLHDPAGGRQVVVPLEDLGVPRPVGDLEDGGESVRRRLVRSEEAKTTWVAGDHVAEERAEHAGGLTERRRRLRDVDRVGAELGHVELLEQQAAVGVRVRAHAPVGARRQGGQLGHERAVAVEEVVRPVASQPLLECDEVARVRAHFRERHLVGAPRSFGRESVDDLRAGPALGGAKDDHRPARPLGAPLHPRRMLDGQDLFDGGVEDGRHPLVHRLRVAAVDPVHRVAVALQQGRQLAVSDPRQHGRAGDLVAVQVQDGEHDTVADRVEKLVRVPARGQGPGLRLAVPDDAADDEVGVVERRSVGVRQRVPELASLVDRPGRLRSHVGGDPAGEGELPEEPAQPLLVVADLRVHLGVCPLEVGVGDRRRASVAGAHHIDGVQIPLADHPVQMRVHEVQPGSRSPVADQAWLHVRGLQGLTQEWVVEQVDLAHRQIVGGAPVGVDQAEILVAGSHDRWHRAAQRGGSAVHRFILRGSERITGRTLVPPRGRLR